MSQSGNNDVGSGDFPGLNHRQRPELHMINEHAEKHAQIFSIFKIKIHTFNVFRHFKRQRSIFKALNQGLNEQMHCDVRMITSAVSNIQMPSYLVASHSRQAFHRASQNRMHRRQQCELRSTGMMQNCWEGWEACVSALPEMQADLKMAPSHGFWHLERRI